MSSSLSRLTANVMAVLVFISSPAAAGRLVDPLVTSAMSSDNHFKKRRLAEFERNLPTLQKHFESVWRYVFRAINPDTHLASSFPEDRRLAFWAVSYDNAIRIMAHVRAGHIGEARKAMDYFMTQSAAQNRHWIENIVDAAEARAGGRTIEHLLHVGPNVYFGLAAISLYKATGDKKYFDFAKQRWELIKGIQNLDPKSFNYGGVPMGPPGVDSLMDQQAGYSLDAPSFAQFYNSEHNADFTGFTKAMMEIDPANEARYLETVRLVGLWVKKVYDPQLHLFRIGTTAKAYQDHDLGRLIPAGVHPLHPLDSSALIISAFGFDGLDALGLEKNPGVAGRIRQAIEENFRVEVSETGPDKKIAHMWGYDFMSRDERKLTTLWEERGPFADQKVAVGKGREALLSDEWSSWVAFADLALADDLAKKGEFEKAESYYAMYKANALDQGLKTAVPLTDGCKAYPYAHPLPYAYNKPVGFGWNTPHESYALIGGLCRYLGATGYDPLRADGALAINFRIPTFPLAQRPDSRPDELIFTEAEQYINKAWDYAASEEWEKAVATVDRLHDEHPDWERIAREQEQLAAREPDFPLHFMNRLKTTDLTPVYKKYWALYHLGTGEFIRLRGDVQLGRDHDATQAMKNILTHYAHAQAFDPSGWMWQIKDSALNEFNYEYVNATQELQKEKSAAKDR